MFNVHQVYMLTAKNCLMNQLRAQFDVGLVEYSRGLNTEHSNSEYIQIPNVLKFRFRMVRFSNHHLKTELFKMAVIA